MINELSKVWKAVVLLADVVTKLSALVDAVKAWFKPEDEQDKENL